MTQLGLDREVVDRKVYDRAVTRFREARILMPTFAQLADPATIPEEVRAALHGVDPDAAHPLNVISFAIVVPPRKASRGEPRRRRNPARTPWSALRWSTR